VFGVNIFAFNDVNTGHSGGREGHYACQQ
jgi:hypothetical protein